MSMYDDMVGNVLAPGDVVTRPYTCNLNPCRCEMCEMGLEINAQEVQNRTASKIFAKHRNDIWWFRSSRRESYIERGIYDFELRQLIVA